MNHLLDDWKEQFFIPAFQHLVLLIVIVVSIKNRNKFKELKYFPFLAIHLVVALISMVIRYTAEHANYHPFLFKAISDYVDYLYTYSELAIFSHFYYQVIWNNILRKAIILTNILFGVFFIIMPLIDRSLPRISEVTQSTVYTVESIILLFVCSYYFLDIFKKIPFVDLKNEPAFWVSIGLLFFMACTLPYSLLENYIYERFPEYFLLSYTTFHFFYILLFLMILKAYLCKPKIAI